MSGSTLELTETDEAGNVTATYIQTSTVKRDVVRIDRIVNALRPDTPKLVTHNTSRSPRTLKNHSRRYSMFSCQPDILNP